MASCWEMALRVLGRERNELNPLRRHCSKFLSLPLTLLPHSLTHRSCPLQRWPRHEPPPPCGPRRTCTPCCPGRASCWRVCRRPPRTCRGRLQCLSSRRVCPRQPRGCSGQRQRLQPRLSDEWGSGWTVRPQAAVAHVHCAVLACPWEKRGQEQWGPEGPSGGDIGAGFGDG